MDKEIRVGEVLQNINYYHVEVYPQDLSNEILTVFNDGFFFIYTHAKT